MKEEGRGKGGKEKKKRRKNRIGRCFIEIRGRNIYLDVSDSSSFQSFVFLHFFFFFPSTTFRPGKILPRAAQRTARRMRTNLCEFLNLLFRHPRLFLSFCTLVFVSFITLKTDRCCLELSIIIRVEIKYLLGIYSRLVPRIVDLRKKRKSLAF